MSRLEISLLGLVILGVVGVVVYRNLDVEGVVADRVVEKMQATYSPYEPKEVCKTGETKKCNLCHDDGVTLKDTSDSPFAKDVDAALSQLITKQREAVAFSKRLQTAMGLTDSQVSTADRESISWEVGGYTISAASRAYIEGCDGWVDILIVGDSHIGFRGYGNPPAGWFFLPKGTGTIVLPSLEEQEIIIQAVKEYKNE